MFSNPHVNVTFLERNDTQEQAIAASDSGIYVVCGSCSADGARVKWVRGCMLCLYSPVPSGLTL